MRHLYRLTTIVCPTWWPNPWSAFCTMWTCIIFDKNWHCPLPVWNHSPLFRWKLRIGRLLITLYLVSNKLLHKPTLYLSDFFEKNKMLYYDNLTRARTHNDLTQWLKFFLEGIRITAQSSIETFKAIITLRDEAEHKIMSLGKKQLSAKSLLQHLYSRPIVDIGDVAQVLEVNFFHCCKVSGWFYQT